MTGPTLPRLDSDYMRPAPDGKAWALIIESGGTYYKQWHQRTTLWYRDPIIALGDLAKHVRQNWAQLDGRAGEMPADPQLAIHMFFQTGYDNDLHTGTWEIAKQDVADFSGVVDERLSGVDPASLPYLLVSAGKDWTCLCGNTAGSSGFYFCTPAGVPIEDPGAGWERHYYCNDCGRVVQQPYGLITGRVIVEPEPVVTVRDRVAEAFAAALALMLVNHDKTLDWALMITFEEMSLHGAQLPTILSAELYDASIGPVLKVQFYGWDEALQITCSTVGPLPA